MRFEKRYTTRAFLTGNVYPLPERLRERARAALEGSRWMYQDGRYLGISADLASLFNLTFRLTGPSKGAILLGSWYELPADLLKLALEKAGAQLESRKT